MFHFYNTLSATGKYMALIMLTAVIIVFPFYIGGIIEGWLGLKGVN
jgi:hypothetical protein